MRWSSKPVTLPTGLKEHKWLINQLEPIWCYFQNKDQPSSRVFWLLFFNHVSNPQDSNKNKNNKFHRTTKKQRKHTSCGLFLSTHKPIGNGSQLTQKVEAADSDWEFNERILPSSWKSDSTRWHVDSWFHVIDSCWLICAYNLCMHIETSSIHTKFVFIPMTNSFCSCTMHQYHYYG